MNIQDKKTEILDNIGFLKEVMLDMINEAASLGYYSDVAGLVLHLDKKLVKEYFLVDAKDGIGSIINSHNGHIQMYEDFVNAYSSTDRANFIDSLKADVKHFNNCKITDDKKSMLKEKEKEKEKEKKEKKKKLKLVD